MLDMGGLEPRTTQLVGAHEVRWTSALSGPKRSGERVPDVSLKNVSQSRDVFLMLDMGGHEPRTTQLVGALDVRGTSGQRGPERSGDTRSGGPRL